jgi:predicted regulator of Ras-like GTPase activity (Roadblock/LC7/MglB family)
MTVLNEALERATVTSAGIEGVFLIAMDGMEVARSGDPGDFPLEFFAATYADLMKKLISSSREADEATPRELMVVSDGKKLIFRAVTPDYGLLAILDRDGLTGRARYELLRAAEALEPELLV